MNTGNESVRNDKDVDRRNFEEWISLLTIKSELVQEVSDDIVDTF